MSVADEGRGPRCVVRRKPAAVHAAVFLVLLAAFGGCGGNADEPWRKGRLYTEEGSYQVKAREGDRVTGVGIYDCGSFRAILEGTPYVIIYNRENGEAWELNMQRKSFRVLAYEEALRKAGFLPHLVMKPYFDLERFWSGAEFRMQTPDGRVVRACMDGPEHLPSLWESSSNGRTLTRIHWEYRRVGKVSADNFRPPEGLTPQQGE